MVEVGDRNGDESEWEGLGIEMVIRVNGKG